MTKLIRPPNVARRVVVRQDPVQVGVRERTDTVLQPVELRQTATVQDDQRIATTTRTNTVFRINNRGLQGPPGAPGGNFLEFTQAAPVLQWTINHNFGYRPSVELFTVGGVEMIAEVVNTSFNQTIVVFNTPTAGSARLL